MQPTLNIEPVLLGRIIANHRLVAELGSGGMGKVFYAEHTVIGRRAAIKILNPDVAKDDAITSRFLNEARAVNETPSTALTGLPAASRNVLHRPATSIIRPQSS